MSKNIIQELDEYQTKAFDEFAEKVEILRKELLDDLAKKFKQSGIPASFKLSGGRYILTHKIHGVDNLLNSLVANDEKDILKNMAYLVSAFEYVRKANYQDTEDTEDTEL